MSCQWWNSELSSLFSHVSILLMVYRFWPCINITTQEPLPSPAVFPRHWSHCQSFTTWAGNTRYLYCSQVTFILGWNVYWTFYVKATLLNDLSHYCWFFTFRWSSCPIWLWSLASVAKNTTWHTALPPFKHTQRWNKSHLRPQRGVFDRDKEEENNVDKRKIIFKVITIFVVKLCQDVEAHQTMDFFI